MVRYIKFTDELEVRVKTSFLGLKDHPDKCTAENLKTATETILTEYGVAVEKVSTYIIFNLTYSLAFKISQIIYVLYME